MLKTIRVKNTSWSYERKFHWEFNAYYGIEKSFSVPLKFMKTGLDHFRSKCANNW